MFSENSGFVCSGVDNAVLRSAGDVKNDLLDLMFIMLSNGGDTSIRDEQGQTLLHRAINLTGEGQSLSSLSSRKGSAHK